MSIGPHKRFKGNWPSRPQIMDLPSPYYLQAMQNAANGIESHELLQYAFDFEDSLEGEEYWKAINTGFHPENIQPETTNQTSTTMKATLTLEDGRTFSVDVDPNELQRPEPNEPGYFDFAAKCPVDKDRPYSSWARGNPFSIGRFCAPKHLQEKCLMVELEYKAEIHNYGSYQLITFEKL